jgi:hypothetical protein
LPNPARSIAARIATGWLRPAQQAVSTMSHSRRSPTTPAQSTRVRLAVVAGTPATTSRSTGASASRCTWPGTLRPLALCGIVTCGSAGG